MVNPQSVKFCLFTFIAFCTMLAGSASAYDVPTLTTQVNALPTATASDQLKKYDLQWVLEDAANNTAYYNADTVNHAWAGTQANNEYNDVSNALSDNTIGTYASSLPANVYPVIPLLTAGVNHNIVFDQAEINFASKLASSSYMNTIPSKYVSTGVIATGVPVVDNNAFGAAAIFELGHPQSSFRPGGSKFNAAAIVPVLRQLQNAADAANHTGDYGNFGWSSGLAEKYLDLITAFPHLLLPTQVSTITQAIKYNAQNISKGNSTFTQNMLASVPGTLYMNADIKDLTAVAYTDYLFPDLNNPYATVVTSGLNFMKSQIFPDGASPYIDRDNECYSYHGIFINELVRYAQITGDTSGLDIIRQTAGYIPLSYEPGTLANAAATSTGRPEWSTAPSWKHFWNSIDTRDVAFEVGMLSHEGINTTFALQNLNWAYLLAATLWDPTAPTSAIPNNYFIYDRNIVGPRGRFGAFSFTGTASEAVPPTGYTDLRGRTNFSGAIILGSDGNIDSGLDGVGIQVQSTASTDSRNVLSQSDAELNTAIVTPNVASLATKFTPHAYNTNSLPTGWSANEQWLFTPQRVIGQLLIHADQNMPGYAIQGTITLVGAGGGSSHGNPLLIDSTYPDTYDYGKLRVHIISQDFGNTLTPVLLNFANQPGDLITLSDTATPTSVTYPAGTTHQFMVEVYDNDIAARSPAGAVTAIVPGNGLRGILLQQGNQQYVQVSNPTSAPLTYTCTIGTSGALIHTSTLTSGEQYRPAWAASVPSSGVPDFRGSISPTTAYIQAAGTAALTIPAYGQVLVEPIASNNSIAGTVTLPNWQGAPPNLTFTLTPTGSTSGSVVTQKLTPSANGSFAFNGVPTGTYILGIKGAEWLRKDTNITVSSAAVIGLTPVLLAGDISGDNQVAGADLAMVRAAYGSAPGMANWNPLADLNGDGQVSAADLALVRANYGKLGDP